jgi:Sec-independent protein translocase protein TatA
VFGIGPLEMLVIAALALMLFSPSELPKLLRGAIQFWTSIKRTADEFREAILDDEDLRELRGVVDEAKRDVRRAEELARREMHKAQLEARLAERQLKEAARLEGRVGVGADTDEPAGAVADDAVGEFGSVARTPALEPSKKAANDGSA